MNSKIWKKTTANPGTIGIPRKLSFKTSGKNNTGHGENWLKEFMIIDPVLQRTLEGFYFCLREEWRTKEYTEITKQWQQDNNKQNNHNDSVSKLVNQKQKAQRMDKTKSWLLTKDEENWQILGQIHHKQEREDTN